MAVPATDATPYGRSAGLRLSVVIPSWNAGRILAGHLPRMVDEASIVAGGAEILVVDDGSAAGDSLADVVRSAGPAVRLLRRTVNGGFAAACNDGALAARGEHLLFLNTDMHVEPGCFETLVLALERHDGVFAVTPVIVNLEGGYPESASRIRFRRGVFDLVQPGRLGEAPAGAGELLPIAYGCGGALLCRRASFLALGGFPVVYAPIYWDDVDLSWRAWRRGLGVLEVGDARILHDHARTMATQAAASRIRALSERNRILFTWVHAEGVRCWASHLALFVPRLAIALLRRDATARGMLAALRLLPAAARERAAAREGAAASAALYASVHASGPAGWPPRGARVGGAATPPAGGDPAR